jgi:3D (Asp-Asp-Asp) domain-containing protein
MDKSDDWEVTFYVADKGARFADGTEVDPDRHAWGVCAVDRSVIRLGSTVNIEGLGTFVARDTGSAVKNHIIDVYIGPKSMRKDAIQRGRLKNQKVTWG